MRRPTWSTRRNRVGDLPAVGHVWVSVAGYFAWLTTVAFAAMMVSSPPPARRRVAVGSGAHRLWDAVRRIRHRLLEVRGVAMYRATRRCNARGNIPRFTVLRGHGIGRDLPEPGKRLPVGGDQVAEAVGQLIHREHRHRLGQGREVVPMRTTGNGIVPRGSSRLAPGCSSTTSNSMGRATSRTASASRHLRRVGSVTPHDLGYPADLIMDRLACALPIKVRVGCGLMLDECVWRLPAASAPASAGCPTGTPRPLQARIYLVSARMGG